MESDPDARAHVFQNRPPERVGGLMPRREQHASQRQAVLGEGKVTGSR